MFTNANPLHWARPGSVEYRRAAHELALFDLAFEQSPAALAVVDELGRFVKANAAFAGLVRAPAAALLGMQLSGLAAEEQRASAREQAAAFLRGAEGSTYECRFDTPTGPAVVALTRRFLHVEGRDYHVILAVDDEASAAQRELMASRLAQAERQTAELAQEAQEAAHGAAAKSQFIAQMSHELRTPLNAILGFSEMLKLQLFGALGHAKYAEYADAIHASGAHLLELINDVLDAAKLEAGRWEPMQERFDLRAALAQCLTMVRPQARSGGIALDCRMPELPLTIESDRRAVKQIALNLLSNAVKFTPEGGAVLLSATVAASDVVIVVADSGVGIAPEHLARLGRPFEQVENPLARKHHGAGLGLALTRMMTERLGGAFSLASEVGSGTVVTIRLPRAPAR
jgi:cell cycle sensor histidine kinase DivJ